MCERDVRNLEADKVLFPIFHVFFCPSPLLFIFISLTLFRSSSFSPLFQFFNLFILSPSSCFCFLLSFLVFFFVFPVFFLFFSSSPVYFFFDSFILYFVSFLLTFVSFRLFFFVFPVFLRYNKGDKKEPNDNRHMHN